MYKKIITITGIITVITGVLGWQLTSFSQSESKYEGCPTNMLHEPSACCVAYIEAIDTIQKAWNTNLSNMMEQEKPASEMVDEGFENLRTYQCWLEYICRAVQFSAYGDPDLAEGGLTSDHLGVIPGCQKVEDMGLVDGWDNFVNFLRSDWEVFANVFQGSGYKEIDVDLPETLFTSNAIPFIPQCMTDPTNKNKDSSNKIELATIIYGQCMDFVDSQFGCKNFDDDISECTSESIAFVKLENELRRTNARQKKSIVENKLISIINKMNGLVQHVTIVKEKMNTLSNKCECYPSSCT